MIALKRIIKYVKTTADFGVWYSKDTNDVLAGYSNADWAENANDRKSTSRGCIYVGNNLVSWMSKKQNFISLSTTEAEYIAVDSCCTQLLWMQKLLHDYGICQEHLTIYCDNASAINISKNPVQHSRTKHIKIRHHFIRELVEDSTLTLEFIHTDDLICLPLTANGLNSFAKTLMSSLWIDLSFSSFFLMHLHLVLCIVLFNMFLFVFFSVLLYFFFHIK